MKKIIFVICLCVFLPNIVNAECTYSEKRDLNTLSSYVDFTYKYNESTKKFDIIIMNISDRIEVRYEDIKIDTENSEAEINNIDEGTQVNVDVYSKFGSLNECDGEHLRIIYISIPYINRFYNNSLCEGHEELTVCNSRFLDYEISYETFIKLIHRSEDVMLEEEKNNNIENEDSYLEIVIKFLQNNWIKAVIFILSSLITYGIFSRVYRKVKHRL